MLNRYSLSRSVRRCAGALVLLLCAGTLPLWLDAAARVGGAVLDLPAADFAARSDSAWYEVFVDAAATLGPDDVRAHPQAFASASRDAVNLGFTEAQAWARFRARHAPERTAAAFLVAPHVLLDEVELFEFVGDELVAQVRSGDAVPFAERPLPYRLIAFELPARPGATVDYLVRVRSPNSALDLELVLLDAPTFQRRVALDERLFGGYFGILGGFAIAALVLFLLLRERVLGCFALYVAAFVAMSAAISGYGMMLLWPRGPGLQQQLPTVLIALTIVCGLVFLPRFLDLVAWPVFRRLFRAATALAVLGAVIHVFAATQLGIVLVIATAVALCPAVFAACLPCALRGDRGARFLLIGWLAWSAGLATTVLDTIGIVASGLFGAHGLYLGALLKFAALVAALADRLRLARGEQDAHLAATRAEMAALSRDIELMVHERTKDLEARNRELGELAIRDSLTGLYNHCATIELLEQMLHQSHRYGFPVTVLMLDLDHFKQVNDTYGHQVGDAVLEAVSRTLDDALRESDVVGRYGGEEFLIAMPHADALAARDFGERLLGRIRAIGVPGAPHCPLSASIGITVSYAGERRLGAAELVGRADAALYRSKREGRDRLTVDHLDRADPEGRARAAGMPASSV